MKKKFALGTATLAFAVVVAGCGPSDNTGGETQTLKVSDWYPENHSAVVDGSKFFMDTVSEASNDAIQFEHYPAEQLGKSGDFLQLTQSGGTDLAALGSSYFPSELPLTNVVTLPGLFSDSCVGATAIWEQLKPGGVIATEEYEPQGLVPLFPYIFSPNEVFTTDQTVAGASDMQGLTLRSAGGTTSEAVKGLGATPITMSAGEIYQAVERGTVSGAVFPYTSLTDYSLDEVVTHGTEGAKLGAFVSVEVINKDIWDSLSDEMQQTMMDAGEKTLSHACESVNKTTAEQKKQLKDAGMTITEIPSDPGDEWQEEITKTHKTWLEVDNHDSATAKELYETFTSAVGTE